LLFGDATALLSGFDPAFLDGVGLQKAVEVLLVSPLTAVVVELHLAGRGVADSGIIPVRQSHSQAFDFVIEKVVLALHGCRQAQPLASSLHGVRVSHFRLDGNSVTQRSSPIL
jgi:hypothetical protein